MKQKTILETPEAALEESAAEAMKYFESQLLTPVIQRRPNFYQRDKTPNTLKMLKEKHRENERQRHHSLNQHLRLICKKVPGSAEDGKETKVLMMQRIISYIAYLENTIKFMSSELNIRPQTSWLSLTSSVKDIEKSGTWRREFSVMSSDDSEDSQVFANNVTCRLKLSSPTIDSTTDSVPGDSVCPSTSWAVESDNLAQESQDSTVPTSSIFLEIDEDSSTRDCQDWLVPQVEVAMDERANFDGLLDQSEYDQALFELPSSTFEVNKMQNVQS
ncbi:unnamed protein product [Lymnaea stagnalis]|uniref:BHLH domain-containing protein n=1 Tax=Lymnaea stagnalis TaxID=6523 RepID=A0AAV2HWU1_LYMST